MTYMSGLSKYLPSVTNVTYESDAYRWLKIFKYNESGTIISFQQDAFFRSSQLINDKQILKKVLGKFYKKYLLGYLQLGSDDLIKKLKDVIVEIAKKRRITLRKTEELEDVLGYFESIGYDIGIFISHTEFLIKNEDQYSTFKYLERLLRTYKNFSIILFSTIDLTNEKYSRLIDECSSLFTNMIVYPLYSKADAIHFMNINCDLWNIKLSTKDKENIYQYTFGYHWLARHIIRFLRDQKNGLNEAIKDELLIKKVSILWMRLSDDEKLIIKKINNHSLTDLDKQTHEYKYLKKIGITGIKLFQNVIEKEIILNKIEILNGELFLNKKNISLNFSPKEFLIMKLLLENKGLLIEREKIAEKIWGDSWEDKYSDWAIDRLIFRLRNKLKSIGIDHELLKTLKSKGIIFG